MHCGSQFFSFVGFCHYIISELKPITLIRVDSYFHMPQTRHGHDTRKQMGDARPMVARSNVRRAIAHTYRRRFRPILPGTAIWSPRFPMPTVQWAGSRAKAG